MTQIGFHNWLVAAPSQKAALAAWDVRENLFAIGSASVVTDPDCIVLAMKSPGVPVAVDSQNALSKATKVLRLEEHRRRKQPAPPTPVRKAEAPPKAAPRKVAPRKRKVDRSKLDRAEAALEAFRKKAVRERAAILRAQKALDLKAEALEVDLEIEAARLEEALEDAQDRYEDDLAGR